MFDVGKRSFTTKDSVTAKEKRLITLNQALFFIIHYLCL
jgi:hypothetical protein